LRSRDAITEGGDSAVALFVLDEVLAWPSAANPVAVELVRRMLGGFS
jgi:hypothetical protein